MYNIVTLQKKGQSLPDLALVMLGAGSSTRFNQRVKKQWLRVEETPLWLLATQNLQQLFPFKQIIVTTTPDEHFYAQKFSGTITFVEGSIQTRIFTKCPFACDNALCFSQRYCSSMYRSSDVSTHLIGNGKCRYRRTLPSCR